MGEPITKNLPKKATLKRHVNGMLKRYRAKKYRYRFATVYIAQRRCLLLFWVRVTPLCFLSMEDAEDYIEYLEENR